MSATVRTSSRIKARKSRISSAESESPSDSKKRKTSKDEQTLGGQGHTSASSVNKTPVKQQHETPNVTRAVAASVTPAKPANKDSGCVPGTPVSEPKTTSATTPQTTTMATRSSQRTSAPAKEESPNNKQAESVATPVPPVTSDTLTTAAVPQVVVTSPIPVRQPTHVFKNPHFTYSNKGGISTGKKTRTWKTLKQIIASERAQIHRPIGSTYSSIDAPPSRRPAKKYSDISGLPAKYTDPRTKLRYANAEEFANLRNLPTDIVNGLLALRRANLDVQ